MELALIIIGAFIVARIVSLITKQVATDLKRSTDLKCNEIREPHRWAWKTQQGFDSLGESAPRYLQCSKCGFIFGSD